LLFNTSKLLREVKANIAITIEIPLILKIPCSCNWNKKQTTIFPCMILQMQMQHLSPTTCKEQHHSCNPSNSSWAHQFHGAPVPLCLNHAKACLVLKGRETMNESQSKKAFFFLGKFNTDTGGIFVNSSDW
jgi:hypothetical protein